MIRKACFFIITLGFFLITAGSLMQLYAQDDRSDERDYPIDLIIALDKSLSMEEEIEAVKTYLKDKIVDTYLKVDDYFLLIPFYQKSEVAIARTIHSEEDKAAVKRVIDGINANGSWTDIGNAFDRLSDELNERYYNNRRKSFLVITDGINEPPPSSQYFRPDGKLVHEFTDDITELEVFPNWKVLVLVIGGDTGFDIFEDDENIQIKSIKEGATPDEIDQSAELFGFIEVIQEKMKPLVLSSKGKGTLTLPLAVKYPEPPNIVIEKISLLTSAETFDNILPGTFAQNLVKEGEDLLSIKVDAKNDINGKKKIEPGTYSGTLEFTFSGKDTFKTPLGVTLHVNNAFEDNPWLIPLIILAALIIIILAIFGIYKIAQGHPIKFRVLVEEMPIPKGKDVFKITKNKQLYMSESLDFIRVTDVKTPKSFAKLSVAAEDLKLFVIKETYFVEPKDIPENVLENTIRIITESGKKYHVKFIEIT